jgi:hypothetical protein
MHDWASFHDEFNRTFGFPDFYGLRAGESAKRFRAYSRKGWRIFHGRPTGFVVNIPTA